MSNKNLRLGIFLGYAPEQGIIDQGIGRLLGFLIKGVNSRSPDSRSIAIACPAWYLPQVRELLADLRIREDAITIVTTDGVPYILRLRDLYRRVVQWRLKRRRLASRWRAATRRIAFKTALSWLGTSSTASFVAQGLLLVVVGLVLLPVMLFLMLLAAAAHLVAKAFAWLGTRFPKARKWVAYAASPLRALRRDEFAVRVYGAIRKQELDRLVQKINRGKIADVWYCPTIFWPEFAGIAGPKVVAVPDIVFVDFPLGYSKKTFEDVFRKAQELIRTETHLVCYSDYVRRVHLVDRLGVAPDRVSVIRHGLVEMQHYCTGASQKDRREWAIQTVNNYMRTRYRDHAYLAEFDFTDTRFALYASQARPHKNLLQLVRTWESLLRKDFCGAKLVLTGRLADEPEVSEFVYARRLQFDILEFSGLPAEILAALNVLAVIAINPTLFEGGFPFTFSEAYSVGTPSVMSRIPAVLELVQQPALRDAMLFDPYNSESIAERVRWALGNRGLLLQMQRPLYDEMARRDWGVAASEYVELFSRLAEEA